MKKAKTSGKTKKEFANEKERDEIIGLLFRVTKKISSRAAIFALKGDMVTG